MKKDAIYSGLYDYIAGGRSINTHSHHLSDRQYENPDLHFVLTNSYSSWMCKPPEKDAPAKEYILANRCNSYFRWLFAGIEALYGLEVSAGNFPEIDRRIRESHKDKSFQLSVLKNECGYDRVFLDKYDDPGSDNGHPGIFTPVYRINPYFFGYGRDARDHNGNSPFDLPLFKGVKTFDDYLGAMKEDIAEAKKRGAVALKNANAYERDIAYRRPARRQAEKAFANPGATDAEIRDFQDFIMFELAKIALETGLPFEIHTGLGKLDGSGPIGLRELIGTFPELKFDLFHAGFPWTGETLGLLHNFLNTHVNIVWLPMISTREAKYFIVKALEISSANRMCWGSDTWTSEESLGAILALRHVLAAALTEMVEDGAFDIAYAKHIADRVLRENAKELYGV